VEVAIPTTPPRALEGPAAKLAHICIVSSGAEGGMGVSVKRGFEALGRRVSYVPYIDWLPTLGSASFRGSGLINRSMALVTRPAIEVRLVALIGKIRPDLVLFIKCDDLHGTAYTAIRRVTSAPLIAYHPDDPWNQATAFRRGSSHHRAGVQIRQVDAMFLWSRALVQRAAVEGAQRAFYLPFACDPELHPVASALTAEETAQLGADVAFIGNWDAEREAWLAPVVEAGIDLAIWGAEYWRDRCKHPGLKQAWRGRPLFGSEQAKAALASKILVNVLRKQNKGACNMRTFEIPCTGGFMLHERSSEAAAFFPPDVACGDFGSSDELIAGIRRWLADPEGRARVAAEGHRRALAWTYREWAGKLLERCEGWAG